MSWLFTDKGKVWSGVITAVLGALTQADVISAVPKTVGMVLTILGSAWAVLGFHGTVSTGK